MAAVVAIIALLLFAGIAATRYTSWSPTLAPSGIAAFLGAGTNEPAKPSDSHDEEERGGGASSGQAPHHSADPYRDRPQSLDDIVGQDAAIKTIRRVIAKARRGFAPPALYLVGPAGTGKTSVGYAVARVFLGDQPPIDFDCSQKKNDPDEVARELRSLVHPGLGTYDGTWDPEQARVVILDEFDRYKPEGRLKLRRPIEDVAADVFIIITANEEIDDLGLSSRLLEIRFKKLDEAALRVLVNRVAAKYQLHPSEAATRTVIRQANGSARDVYKFLAAVDEDLLVDDEPQDRQGGSATRGVTLGMGGRPKADHDYEEAKRLRREGVSWEAIGERLKVDPNSLTGGGSKDDTEPPKSARKAPPDPDAGAAAYGGSGTEATP
jgi:DNA polymerase III delta prime subunit